IRTGRPVRGLLRSRGSGALRRSVTRGVARPVCSGGARGVEQAVARRASGVREDAAGPSRDAWRDAAATGSARTEGTGPGAHRSAYEAGATPGYAWRWCCAASGASVRIERDHRYIDFSDGQGRACGHRGDGGQARHGSVPHRVARPNALRKEKLEVAMSILWTIIIGFVAGVIAKLLYPGNKYEPTGFILTTVLGIIGAFVATYLGQAVGWYKAGEGAGFIGAIVGAIIILTAWGFIAPRFERT